MAATKRTSVWMGRVPPTRSKVWSWSTRRSFAWSAGRMSPISSRNTVPPWATSSFPRFCWCAPVNAPFSWPNSSDSRSSSLRATQLTTTNGWSARRLHRWIARAMTSLPVPLSPRSSTVAPLGAARRATSSAARICELSPTMAA